MKKETLHIKKSALTGAKILEAAGLVLVFFTIPYLFWIVSHTDALLTELYLTKKAAQLLLPGAILAILGAAWKGRLYRCPNCGREILPRELFPKPPRWCSGCGTEIIICIDE